MRYTLFRRKAERERGAALIEMAAVSPLLILLVFGAGDFGRVMYHGVTLTNAARAGAEYGRDSSGKAALSGQILVATQDDAQDIPPFTINSQRICECPSGTVVSCTTQSCAGYGAPLVFVEVTATTTFMPLTAPFPGIPASVPLSRVAKVRAQ